MVTLTLAGVHCPPTSPFPPPLPSPTYVRERVSVLLVLWGGGNKVTSADSVLLSVTSGSSSSIAGPAKSSSCIVLPTFPVPALPPHGPDLLIRRVNYWLPLHVSRPLGADSGCCASVALPFFLLAH